MPIWNQRYATVAAVDAAAAAAAAAQATANSHAPRHSLGAADMVDPSDLGVFDNWTASSPVATVPRLQSTTTLIVTTYAYGVKAQVMASGTYTGIRFCQRTAAGAMTYLFAGVYNADATALLAQTADLSLASGLNVLFEAPLDVSVVLEAGDEVVLALGGVFTGAPTFQGLGHNSSITTNVGSIVVCFRSEINEVTVAGLPSDLSSVSGRNILPWIELTT